MPLSVELGLQEAERKELASSLGQEGFWAKPSIGANPSMSVAVKTATGQTTVPPGGPHLDLHPIKWKQSNGKHGVDPSPLLGASETRSSHFPKDWSELAMW